MWLGKSAANVRIVDVLGNIAFLCSQLCGMSASLPCMRKLDEQLKAAITRMPVAEKDKLLLRLVAKDEKLVRKLVFELLEGSSTRDERAMALKMEIQKQITEAAKYSLSPGYLLLDLRHWNARITEHVQVTKDKAGEVALTFFLLAEAFRVHGGMLRKFPESRSDTFAPYVVKRVMSLLPKALKLHEDHFIEFRKDAREVLEQIWAFPPTAKLAAVANLPQTWDL
jgi:hypothetical protein